MERKHDWLYHVNLKTPLFIIIIPRIFAISYYTGRMGHIIMCNHYWPQLTTINHY